VLVRENYLSENILHPPPQVEEGDAESENWADSEDNMAVPEDGVKDTEEPAHKAPGSRRCLG